MTAITTNLEEYDGKLNALVAAGQTPDMFICNPGPNMDVYVNAGVAADLTDILTNQEADWYSSFTDGIFERMTYDGKIMAVPTNFAAALCFYNTEIFDAAGVEVPTTYTELLDACQKIKDAGYTPISCSAGTAWCLSMVASYLCDRRALTLRQSQTTPQTGPMTTASRQARSSKNSPSTSRRPQQVTPTIRQPQTSTTAKLQS